MDYLKGDKMSNYIKRENIKFVVSIIVFIVAMLIISGSLEERSNKQNERLYRQGYKKGYSDALEGYSYDDSYDTFDYDIEDL